MGAWHSGPRRQESSLCGPQRSQEAPLLRGGGLPCWGRGQCLQAESIPALPAASSDCSPTRHGLRLHQLSAHAASSPLTSQTLKYSKSDVSRALQCSRVLYFSSKHASPIKSPRWKANGVGAGSCGKGEERPPTPRWDSDHHAIKGLPVNPLFRVLRLFLWAGRPQFGVGSCWSDGYRGLALQGCPHRSFLPRAQGWGPAPSAGSRHPQRPSDGCLLMGQIALTQASVETCSGTLGGGPSPRRRCQGLARPDLAGVGTARWLMGFSSMCPHLPEVRPGET